MGKVKKSKIINSHAAPRQALGYIFQFERALFWLSKLDADSCVSIETDDDVVINLAEGGEMEKIYEQDKSALSKRNPFSNHSPDLWKSLAIWAEGINSGKFIILKSKFLLVTNKTISKTCLIYQLTKEQSELEFDESFKKFTAILQKPSSTISEYCKIVSQLSTENLKSLFQKIEVHDLNYLHDRKEYKRSIVKNLKISDQITPNQVYVDLFGWLMEAVVNFWVNKQNATIKVEDLLTKSNEIISLNFKKPFIELAEISLPITEHQRKENMGQNFVKQLNWIELNDDDILSAIDDFLRAKWERSRYAEEGNIPSVSHFKDFENELKAQWKAKSELHAIDADTEELKLRNGKRVYWSLINTKIKLAGYETDQRYTTNGGYHRLANKFEIGWHIDWKNLKDK